MLVYGRNVVNEILDNNTKIFKVFLDNNFNDEIILSKIEKKKLKKFHIDKNKLDRMCNSSTNQGIALDIEDSDLLCKSLEQIKIEINHKDFRDFNLSLYDEHFNYYNDLQKYFASIFLYNDLLYYLLIHLTLQ